MILAAIPDIPIHQEPKLCKLSNVCTTQFKKCPTSVQFIGTSSMTNERCSFYGGDSFERYSTDLNSSIIEQLDKNKNRGREEAEHVPPGGRGEAPRPCG
jgi:hypothetical protein